MRIPFFRAATIEPETGEAQPEMSAPSSAPVADISLRDAYNSILARIVARHVSSLFASVPVEIQDDDEGMSTSDLRALGEGATHLKELLESVTPPVRGRWAADLVLLGNAFAIKEGEMESQMTTRLRYMNPFFITTHIVVRDGKFVIDGYTVDEPLYAMTRSALSFGWGGLISRAPIQPGRAGHYTPDQVLHIRNEPDDYYGELYGLIPLRYAQEQLTLDHEQTTYTKTVLHNIGVTSGLVTPKGGGRVPPTGDGRSLASIIGDAIRAARRGQMAWINSDVEVKPLGTKPADLMLDRLHQGPESRVAALLGVPVALLQLLVALERSQFRHLPTLREYEAEFLILPMLNVIAHALTKQVAREFIATGEVTFDQSALRVLEPDLDQAVARLVTLASAGLISEAAVLAEIKRLGIVGQEALDVMEQEQREMAATVEQRTPSNVVALDAAQRRADRRQAMQEPVVEQS